ncbi:MAG: hypothetical protein DCC56_10780 [Anaerolineae bacterium]|nr:MAG: hypothetical protein DCC56_10780 [Anaerolineae bacterium]WKZ45665.1 MAG: lamin tail domain-containing protein [Anaerolineales bacterium]
MKAKESVQNRTAIFPFVVLLLVSLACGTSSNVTIPTSDPNSIQTAIAGTAQAAELQTSTASAPIATLIPTNSPEQSNSPIPIITIAATETSTLTLEPTALPSLTNGAIIRIKTVNKEEEFVDLENFGNQPQNLSGWSLISEKGDQICSLSGTIMPGEILRVWANNPNGGGFNCNFGTQIWNNSESDPAVLRDNNYQEVSRYP